MRFKANIDGIQGWRRRANCLQKTKACRKESQTHGATTTEGRSGQAGERGEGEECSAKGGGKGRRPWLGPSQQTSSGQEKRRQLIGKEQCDMTGFHDLIHILADLSSVGFPCIIHLQSTISTSFHTPYMRYRILQTKTQTKL